MQARQRELDLLFPLGETRSTRQISGFLPTDETCARAVKDSSCNCRAVSIRSFPYANQPMTVGLYTLSIQTISHSRIVEKPGGMYKAEHCCLEAPSQEGTGCSQ